MRKVGELEGPKTAVCNQVGAASPQYIIIIIHYASIGRPSIVTIRDLIKFGLNFVYYI